MYESLECVVVIFLLKIRPPRSTRTYTLFPSPTPFRSEALRGIAVGDGAAADDAAGAQVAGLRRMGDQVGQAELHVGTGVGLTEHLTVQMGDQRPADFRVFPGVAKFIGGDGHRREGS